MKKICWILLMMITLIAAVGCNKEVTKPEDGVTTGNEASFGLIDIIPMEMDFTLYYSGSYEYGDYRTVVDISENHNEKTTFIHMEGEADDASGGESGDTSFIKKYKITDESIELGFSDAWMPLIKAPLQEGNEWTGLWCDRLTGELGSMQAKTMITEITENTITTELTPVEEKKPYKDYKVVTTYEIGKGMISQVYTYPSWDGGGEPYEMEIRLAKTSKISDSNHIRRYTNPENNLDQFYKFDDSFYDSFRAEAANWLITEKNLTDENIEKKYNGILKQLPWGDFKTIKTAKEIAFMFAPKTSDQGEIMMRLIEYYEEAINNLNEQFLDDNFMYSDEIFELYSFDEDNFCFILNVFKEFNNPAVRAKALVLYENGISLACTEGFYYFTPQYGYINDRFNNMPDYLIEYLELKDWEYKREPLLSEGYLTIELEELVNHMLSLEDYGKKYPAKEQGKWAKDQSDIFLQLYIVPGYSWFYNDLYLTGKVGTEYIENFENFTKNHKDSSYYELVNSVYTYLKNNDFQYSEELDEYLKVKGFEPYVDESIYRTITEKEQQLEDFKSLMKTKESIEIYQNQKKVTVKNGEELVKAIASDTTIYLEPGTYVLPYEYESDDVNIDYGELRLNNIENLVIVGQSQQPVTVMTDSYDFVFVLYDCSNISLCNLRMGHTNEYCKGGVIEFGDCKEITLNECILFGCGYWGLETSMVENLTIANTLIADCETEALRLCKSENIDIKNCAFKRNGEKVIDIDTCTDVTFEKVDVTDNKNTMNQSDTIFTIKNSENIEAISCTFEDNGADKLVNEEKYLTIEEEL